MFDERALLEMVRDSPEGVGWGLVVLVAAAEYLMPFLPADTVLLGGALLVVAGKHSFLAVWIAAVLGGAVGGSIQHRLGVWLKGRTHRISFLVSPEQIERMLVRIEQNGDFFMLVNRGMPGVRGAAFIAAGMSGMPLARALGFGLLSQAIWAGAILAIGVWIGDNWSRLETTMEAYRWVVLGVVIVLLAAWLLFKRWKSKSSSSSP